MQVIDNSPISKHPEWQHANNRLSELLKQYAIENPKKFCDSLKKSLNDTPDSNYTSNGPKFHGILGAAALISPLTFGAAVSGGAVTRKVVTFSKKKELYDNLEANLKKYLESKDAQAERDLSIIIKEIDTQTLLKILSHLPTKIQKQFVNAINPHKNANNSSMQVEIKKNNTPKGTDGQYLLWLKKDGAELPVHFNRSESFIIYLIYLINKYLNDLVDAIYIWNYKELFVKLFNKNYDYNENNVIGLNNCEKLYEQNSKKKMVYRAQMRDCFADICKSISGVCEKLNENPLPYIIKDSSGHLAILKSNIILHKDILEIVEKTNV